MIRITYFLSTVLISMFLLACGGKGGDAMNQGEVVLDQGEASAKTSKTKANGLPVVPNELMQLLVDSTDYVDYLFYEMDFSMSMDNKQGIMYSIAKIGEHPAQMNAACKPIGRIFYQIKGRNAAEADLYFSKGCAYMVFMKDNAPVYANNMSKVGMDFLNNQFAAIMKDYQPVE